MGIIISDLDMILKEKKNLYMTLDVHQIILILYEHV